jgi:ribonuclease HII
MKLIGIDDAGRGPAIGPMVLAGVLVEEKDEELLREWGTKDSKLLTPKKRDEIKEYIINKFKYHLEMAQPKEIDESSNLNYTEAVKAAMIINHLTKELNEPVKVIIDCPSVNIGAWSSDVQKLIKKPEIIHLSCEHKADEKYPAVSAASILAKEKREEELKKLRKELGVEFGSGYPGDPVTKDFLKENHSKEKYRKIIRYSWSTLKKLEKANDKNQKKLF